MTGGGASALAGLRAELEALASDQPGVSRGGTGESTEYLVGTTAVCAISPDGVSFRVGASVAKAAAKTPDVMPSARGPEWVRFAPKELDRFALDRATSWFELAIRLAGTAG